MIPNYNKHLRPIDSPAEKNVGRTSSVEFDRKTQADSIRNYHVKNLSFSILNGGTAILGGLADGDGVLSVNNAGGTEVVRLDKTGIYIASGTITGVTLETISSGTIANSFIGTSTITGGTINSAVINNGTANNQFIGSPAITGGTASSFLLGTSTVTGGTVNPSLYQINGTSGADGSIVYVKTVDFGGSATTFGTAIVNKGLITSIT